MSNTPEKLHSELGASVAARWMACPGSVRLSRGQPNYETEHSRAGTTAHAVAELCLTKTLDPDVYEGMQIEGVEVDENMVAAVRVYIDYCRQINANASGPAKYWVEKKFSLATLNPPGQMFGTCDFALYDPSTRQLHVVDYKNGSGVVVEAKGNKQLRYYGLGAVIELEKELGGLTIDEVVLTIVQPNAAHPQGVVRSDHISYVDLLDFAGELLAAARLTLDPNAPLVAGSHCRFCPASAICPAQREAVEAAAMVTFEAMPLDVPPDPATLPLAVLSDILGKLPVLEEWAKSVRVHALRRLESGEEVPGFKLVQRKANRKWVNEAQVIKWAEEKGLAAEEIYKQDLKSPAQIEKVVGKKNLPADFTMKPDTGYTMVADTDKREAVSLHPGDAFTEITAGE